MSEKEKDMMKRFSDAIPKLDEKKQNYILGVAEGMSFARQEEEREKNKEIKAQSV